MKYTRSPNYPTTNERSLCFVGNGKPFKIHYTNPLALAHEVAHAIEYQLYGKTSEYTAWKLAHSFIKPEYWNGALANKWYRTYSERDRFDYVILPDGRAERVYSSRAKYPKTLRFDLKVSKRTRKVLKKILEE